MRFLLLTIGFIGFFVSPVMAQTVYIPPGSSGSGTTNAPLNLKSMLQGKKQQKNLQRKYTYQGRSYGVDRSAYSLALSPEEARQNQIRLNREAANREREKARQRAEMEKRTQDYLAAANARSSRDEMQTNTVLRESRQQAQRKRVLYNQDRTGLSVPKRVFNSPY